jgi:hypothetical protein
LVHQCHLRSDLLPSRIPDFLAVDAVHFPLDLKRSESVIKILVEGMGVLGELGNFEEGVALVGRVEEGTALADGQV